MHAGAWYYSTDHEQLCQVLEVQTLWGSTTCRIWLQESNSLTWVAAERLTPIEVLDDCSADHIVYVASAARVADALHQNLLLAPIESSVIPLPHQIRALSRAIAGDRVRYLLADEVGLGKTIEAGLILRELKLRGLVRRTLVIAPKGLVQQWVSEMRFHFGETFQLVLADDLRTLQRISETDSHGRASSGDPWHMFSQIVVPMDSVKPLERRKGWTASQIQEYNRERFEDLLAAGWDLIIVDEAHRLGGSTEQVARYKLGKGLANAAPYLLLLSATPHQGKTDSFHRLVSLLDEMAFPDVDSVSRERVQPYVIRTEKRKAIDAEGKPLFTPRNTQLVSIAWQDRHSAQRELYEAVTDYVREGYNLALREKRNYIGFLMILMQRMVTSSTSAIRSALGKRLEVLRSDTQEIGSTERSELRMLDAESIYDLDGQEQAEILLRSKLKAFRNEQAEVQLLLDAAIRCEQSANDAKAEALLEWIYRLQAEEGDPDLKILVFTEFLSTQDMLFRFLSERGFSVVCLNGTMDLDTRTRVQQEFADHARILVSTDAGGEGLNLQFCHVVINYDMPWNPMQLEQRIGRVDRIGQRHSVRAINFVLEDSIEHRVQEVLEEKLEIIFREFGIDKTGDVLDSAQAGALFDDMYIKAILAPESLTESIEQAVSIVREQAQEARDTASVLASDESLDPKAAQQLLVHPLSYWVERMTVSYLRSHGGTAEKQLLSWKLHWPDGETFQHAVFTMKEVEAFPSAQRLTLEHPRIRTLLDRVPRMVSGQRIPVISLAGITEEVNGYWSVWRTSICAPAMESSHPVLNRQQCYFPLFLADNGAVYLPTARHIWDLLMSEHPVIRCMLDAATSSRVLQELIQVAEEHGKPYYEKLLQEHGTRLHHEREKAAHAFAARRKMIEKIGLPQVRMHRLHLLAREEQACYERLARSATLYPELTPLLVIRVEGRTHG